jgi:hypothetical protein
MIAKKTIFSVSVSPGDLEDFESLMRRLEGAGENRSHYSLARAGCRVTTFRWLLWLGRMELNRKVKGKEKP